MIYQNREEAIMALKQDVQQKLGHSLDSPKEFALLSSCIKESTAQTVSASTLMRVWDYVGSDVRPRITTLNTLALFLGFKSFEEFCEGKNDSSADVIGEYLNVLEQLRVRDHLLLRWDPGRVLLARYLGNAQFVPLYLDNLVHGDNPPHRYVCGRHNGVTFEVIPAIH